jgi:hypothetical protein
LGDFFLSSGHSDCKWPRHLTKNLATGNYSYIYGTIATKGSAKKDSYYPHNNAPQPPPKECSEKVLWILTRDVLLSI